MADADAMVKVGDQMINLADLAGIDMTGVDEKRMESFPAGRFRYRFKAAGYKAFGTGEDAKPVWQGEFECVHVYSLLDDTEKPEKWLGKSFFESIFINEPDDIGRVKARLVDIGYKFKPGLGAQQHFDAAVGTEFDAQVIKTPNKKNPDGDPFTNLRKVKPYISEAEMAAATKAA